MLLELQIKSDLLVRMVKILEITSTLTSTARDMKQLEPSFLLWGMGIVQVRLINEISALGSRSSIAEHKYMNGVSESM